MSQSLSPEKLRACLHFTFNNTFRPADRLALANSVTHPAEALLEDAPPGLSVHPGQWREWLATPALLDTAFTATADWLAAIQPGSCHRRVVSFWDEAYPAALKQLPRPPWLLFVEGALPADHQPVLAIVGSRNATRIGLRRARDFARDMAREGWVIASGLARGIDAAAHAGALDASQPTIAVLGCGIDFTYPPENAALRQSILDHRGCIVSEYPPGTAPHPRLFPARNRIIAGLSRGVLVVEAAPRSGSLITAHLANELGRAVMAIPGSIDSTLSRGCHQMIRSGARLVETLNDLREELGIGLKKRGGARKPPSPPPENGELNPRQQKVLALFGQQPLQFDDLSNLSGLTAGELSGTLFDLEMAGHLECRPGHWWHPA